MSFSQNDFIQCKKVELKKIMQNETYFFLPQKVTRADFFLLKSLLK